MTPGEVVTALIAACERRDLDAVCALVTDDIDRLEFEMPIWICDAVELKETGTTIGLNP